MAASTLNCPMCGAAASTDSARCLHCGARLATVACPSCFGMIFVGSKFCSHCGARADRAEAGSKQVASCPRCKIGLQEITLANTALLECAECHGIWVDAAALDQICAEREKQSAVLGAATPWPESASGSIEKNIRYLPCPVCGKLMHRVNFARCSQVIVDVCKGHGTWFDRDELRRIVEFIRAGGLETARNRQLADLEERRRQLRAAETASAWDTRNRTELDNGLSAAAALLRGFFK